MNWLQTVRMLNLFPAQVVKILAAAVETRPEK
jgi:hypothetical protein